MIAGKARVFTDQLNLIFSNEIVAVLIETPDSTHADLLLACIKAGKPVLCEKPLAMTAVTARQVVEAEYLPRRNQSRWLQASV